jgi:hypothetical protein
MGLYVEVPHKEQWFIDNVLRSGDDDKPRMVCGEGEVNISELQTSVQPDEVICCLVDNGMFSALAVGFSDSKIEAFNQEGDSRPKHFGIFKKETLKQVCPTWDIYMEKDDE